MTFKIQRSAVFPSVFHGNYGTSNGFSIFFNGQDSSVSISLRGEWMNVVVDDLRTLFPNSLIRPAFHQKVALSDSDHAMIAMMAESRN